jgi:type IV secretory pathway VirB10-like protein
MLAAVAAVVLLTWVFMRGKREPEPNQANLDTRAAAPNVVEPTAAAPAEPKAAMPTVDDTPDPAMTAVAAPVEPPAAEPAKSPAPAAAKETRPTETPGATKETKTASAATQPKAESKPAEAKPAEAKPTAATAEPKEVAVGGPFDTAAAAAALGSAAQEASGCRKEGDPSGVAVVHVTFSNAGRATRAVIEGPPFAGTQTGGCIASTLRKATVPPYGGDRVTVTKRVTIH